MKRLESHLVTKTFRGQELADVVTLVTLKLNDGTQLSVLHNASVATKVFLDFLDKEESRNHWLQGKDLQNQFQIQFFIQALNSCYTLASVALLHSYVNVASSFASCGNDGADMSSMPDKPTLSITKVIRKRISYLKVDKIGHTTGQGGGVWGVILYSVSLKFQHYSSVFSGPPRSIARPIKGKKTFQKQNFWQWDGGGAAPWSPCALPPAQREVASKLSFLTSFSESSLATESETAIS